MARKTISTNMGPNTRMSWRKFIGYELLLYLRKIESS